MMIIHKEARELSALTHHFISILAFYECTVSILKFFVLFKLNI